MAISLRAKILISSLGLVLVLLVASSYVLNILVKGQVRRTAEADLRRTRTVFDANRAQRARHLVADSRLLSADYAFRSLVSTYDPAIVSPPRGAPVIPFPAPRVSRGGGPPATRITPASDIARRLGQTAQQPPAGEKSREGAKDDLSDMEIPTFIRRQMD